MFRFLPILLFAFGLTVTTDDIYDNSYALIIGIDKYENVSNLDYAVKDANSIATLLKDNFNFLSINIKILLNDEATFTNVRNSLAKISSSSKKNDRVLIYFAGHGETMDLPDGGEMGYLLPIDGKRDNLFATAIPMDDFKKISSMSQAKHMLFLIDACYGGLAAIGSRGISSASPNYIEKITKDKSRQIITAGGKGEKVIEKSEWGHSAFTMNLLRGLGDGKGDLNDDGYITADELGLFLKEKVTIDSDNQQTPQSRRFTSHEGEFIFSTNISQLEINNPQFTINKSTNIDYSILAKELARELKKQNVPEEEMNENKGNELHNETKETPAVSIANDNEEPIIEIVSILDNNEKFVQRRFPLLAFGLSFALTPLVGNLYVHGPDGFNKGFLYNLSEGFCLLFALINAEKNTNSTAMFLTAGSALHVYYATKVYNESVQINIKNNFQRKIYFSIQPKFGYAHAFNYKGGIGPPIGGSIDLRWKKTNKRIGISFDGTTLQKPSKSSLLFNLYGYYEQPFGDYFGQINFGIIFGTDKYGTDRYGIFSPTIGAGIAREYKIWKHFHIRPAYSIHLASNRASNHVLSLGLASFFN